MPVKKQGSKVFSLSSKLRFSVEIRSSQRKVDYWVALARQTRKTPAELRTASRVNFIENSCFKTFPALNESVWVNGPEGLKRQRMLQIKDSGKFDRKTGELWL